MKRHIPMRDDEAELLLEHTTDKPVTKKTGTSVFEPIFNCWGPCVS